MSLLIDAKFSILTQFIILISVIVVVFIFRLCEFFFLDFKHRKSQTHLVCWSTDHQEAGLLLVVKTWETHE